MGTDPRDMIFGLHSIFEIVEYPLSDPDYAKPCHIVNTEAAKAAIDLDRTTDISYRTFGSDIWPKLSSWVPDWSATHHPNFTQLMAGQYHASGASILKSHIPGMMNGEKWVDDEDGLAEFEIV